MTLRFVCVTLGFPVTALFANKDLHHWPPFLAPPLHGRLDADAGLGDAGIRAVAHALATNSKSAVRSLYATGVYDTAYQGSFFFNFEN